MLPNVPFFYFPCILLQLGDLSAATGASQVPRPRIIPASYCARGVIKELPSPIPVGGSTFSAISLRKSTLAAYVAPTHQIPPLPCQLSKKSNTIHLLHQTMQIP
jgi:hypothetical protein